MCSSAKQILDCIKDFIVAIRILVLCLKFIDELNLQQSEIKVLGPQSSSILKNILCLSPDFVNLKVTQLLIG